MSVTTHDLRSFKQERRRFAMLTAYDFPTARAADVLVAAGVACVGIDSLNIDAIDGTGRPVHTTLLGAEIPIVEHLTRLDRLPERGFRFTAVPPKICGAGTFTVRAYATVGK